MATNEDGGPAFPFKCQGPTTAPETYCGMTLRDYFAAKAMAGILLSDTRAGSVFSPTDDATFFEIAAGVGNTQAEAVAWRSYAMADAMLKARQS